MKAIISLGALTLGLSLLLTGCGGNACEKLADAEAAKDAECKVPASTMMTTAQDDSVCTDELALLAECRIACVEKVACAGYSGDDFDAMVDYQHCRFECH